MNLKIMTFKRESIINTSGVLSLSFTAQKTTKSIASLSSKLI